MAIQLIYRSFFHEREAKQSFRIVLTNRPKARISILMVALSLAVKQISSSRLGW